MRWKRVIGITAAVLVGIYLVWLLAAAWFVRDGIRRINDSQPYVTFSMGWATSWWPGHLSGRDLHVLIHDTDVELDIHIDSFYLDVELAPLAHIHFVTEHTRLDGLTLFFRQTRKLPELCAWPTLPPIEGQARADAADCLAQKETALPPQGGGPETIWRLDLADVEITDVRDVWIEDVRFRGKGQASGRFYLWPTQELDLASESAHWDDTRVTLGAETPLATVASIDVAAVMRDMDVPHHRIWEEVTSADITATGALFQLARVGAAGVAKADLEAHMRDGLASGLAAKAHSDDFSLPLGEKHLGGTLDVRLRADSKTDGKALSVHEVSAKLHNVNIDGKKYDDADLAISALPGGHIDPKTGHGVIELIGTGKSARPLLALLPPTFGTLVAKLAIGPDSPITGAVNLHGPPQNLTAKPITLQGGPLELAGQLTLTPALKANLTARLGPVSKSIEVP